MLEIIAFSAFFNDMKKPLEIKNIGLYLDCEDGVSRLISDMRIRIKTFREENNNIKFKPKVAFVEWLNPIYVGGNWIPELIEIAGGTSCFGVSGEHSTIINFDEINILHYFRMTKHTFCPPILRKMNFSATLTAFKVKFHYFRF